MNDYEKRRKKFFKSIVITLLMICGLMMGVSVNENIAQDPSNDCGVCDHVTFPDVGGFCNFVFYGSCAGNNGGPCGAVACGGNNEPPIK